MRQEACRKDVERAFGVLQARFAILAVPVRVMDKNIVSQMVKAGIIMHTMIVEEERSLGDHGLTEYECSPESMRLSHDIHNHVHRSCVQSHGEVRDATLHVQLRQDLIEHLYSQKRESKE
ncbi:hypothetical protein G6F56_005866 [Rhizopus delemar]|nr:hypothetical protein G6F56_005866 [Rhizopus delemar]